MPVKRHQNHHEPPRAEKELDKESGPKPRGRPKKIHERPQAVIWRMENYRDVLSSIWSLVGDKLVNAQTPTEIEDIWRTAGLNSGYGQLPVMPDFAKQLLVIVKERKFPKSSKAQVEWIAKSVACPSGVSARTCRDFCEKHRAANSASRQSHGEIIAVEWYVRCTCGYEGPSQGHACPNCTASIPFDWIK